MAEDMEARWAELERLAKEATPGPWEQFNVRHRGPGHQVHVGRGRWGVAHITTGSGIARDANAAFIAAANPSTILALLSERRKMVEALERAIADELGDNWRPVARAALTGSREHG